MNEHYLLVLLSSYIHRNFRDANFGREMAITGFYSGAFVAIATLLLTKYFLHNHEGTTSTIVIKKEGTPPYSLCFFTIHPKTFLQRILHLA